VGKVSPAIKAGQKSIKWELEGENLERKPGGSLVAWPNKFCQENHEGSKFLQGVQEQRGSSREYSLTKEKLYDIHLRDDGARWRSQPITTFTLRGKVGAGYFDPMVNRKHPPKGEVRLQGPPKGGGVSSGKKAVLL